MIEHVVMFQFSGTADQRKATARSFKEDLEDLYGKIPCLIDLEVGVNCNPAEQWDLTLHATVENFEDLAKYSAHPSHVAAVAKVKDRIAARACVDYQGDDFDED